MMKTQIRPGGFLSTKMNMSGDPCHAPLHRQGHRGDRSRGCLNVDVANPEPLPPRGSRDGLLDDAGRSCAHGRLVQSPADVHALHVRVGGLHIVDLGERDPARCYGRATLVGPVRQGGISA